MMRRPDDTWVRSVCKVGQGHACCRYLTMAPDGWSCEKLTATGRYLDSRVAAETIVARGDNCDGLASSTPEADFEGTLEDMIRGTRP